MPFTINTDITIPTPVADYIDDQVSDFIRQNNMRGTRNESRVRLILREGLESAYRYAVAGQVHDDDIISKTKCLRRQIRELRELVPNSEP